MSNDAVRIARSPLRLGLTALVAGWAAACGSGEAQPLAGFACGGTATAPEQGDVALVSLFCGFQTSEDHSGFFHGLGGEDESQDVRSLTIDGGEFSGYLEEDAAFSTLEDLFGLTTADTRDIVRISETEWPNVETDPPANLYFLTTVNPNTLQGNSLTGSLQWVDDDNVPDLRSRGYEFYGCQGAEGCEFDWTVSIRTAEVGAISIEAYNAGRPSAESVYGDEDGELARVSDTVGRPLLVQSVRVFPVIAPSSEPLAVESSIAAADGVGDVRFRPVPSVADYAVLARSGTNLGFTGLNDLPNVSLDVTGYRALIAGIPVFSPPPPDAAGSVVRLTVNHAMLIDGNLPTLTVDGEVPQDLLWLGTTASFSLDSGEYEILVVDDAGRSASIRVNVEDAVTVVRTVSAAVAPSGSVVVGTPVTLSATPDMGGNYTFEWVGNDISIGSGASLTHTPTVSTAYSVIMRDESTSAILAVSDELFVEVVPPPGVPVQIRVQMADGSDASQYGAAVFSISTTELCRSATCTLDLMDGADHELESFVDPGEAGVAQVIFLRWDGDCAPGTVGADGIGRTMITATAGLQCTAVFEPAAICTPTAISEAVVNGAIVANSEGPQVSFSVSRGDLIAGTARVESALSVGEPNRRASWQLFSVDGASRQLEASSVDPIFILPSTLSTFVTYEIELLFSCGLPNLIEDSATLTFFVND